MTTLSHPTLEEAYILPRTRMDWFLNHYLNDLSEIEDIRVSPALNPDLSGQPKTLIATGGFDPLRDEGMEYGKRLRENGVDVT